PSRLQLMVVTTTSSFYFSSRRRHTICLSDWSSDVCSSDLVPYFWVNYWRGDGGRSHSLNLMPEVDFKLASRVTAAIIPNYTRTSNDVQPLGQHDTRYVFAHLEQKQLGVTMRFTYPFTASA